MVIRQPGPALRELAPQSPVSTPTMINLVDGKWHQATAQANTFWFAQRLFPRDVTLLRNGGPLTIGRLDVLKNAQVALNWRTPL
ncbi:hypothetical protein F4827_002189 [Paraburkholderia bannensis]|uniref:Uncharacterized protein n=1 Tax=Paraburkholderia bannensis TaxID=765414 RepID=A0A7W9TY47_9BURK|nr:MULTISPECIES: hypothetical protein [Paraburkholderia]MBB3257264.1 hypothetical protein [Paraburkholderia sp. WP4_3_2]MBB6102340.1 hypothetical protein [Paraburkholderia bannensis]